jgi:acetyltransferase-like isoleucine patch superfamily enzyme
VFFLIGHNITIEVGNKTTITRDVEINAQEYGMSIEIGEDCMFSNHITIRTSDSHPYYDIDNVRLNNPKPVRIGNHVWIAPNTKVMKGAVIGDGAIIGSDTTVTKTVPNNALYVGRPGKTIRADVHWTREDICYK